MPDTTTTAPSVTLADGAEKYIGTPYVLGSNNPKVGLDCSGLVGLVAKDLGIALPGSTGFPNVVTMVAHWITAANKQQTNGEPGAASYGSDLTKLQRGDLVYWLKGQGGATTNHVAIYMGNGKIVSALNPSQGVLETNLTDITAKPVGWLRPADTSGALGSGVGSNLPSNVRIADANTYAAWLMTSGGDPTAPLSQTDIDYMEHALLGLSLKDYQAKVTSGNLIPGTQDQTFAAFLKTLEPGMSTYDIVLPAGHQDAEYGFDAYDFSAYDYLNKPSDFYSGDWSDFFGTRYGVNDKGAIMPDYSHSWVGVLPNSIKAVEGVTIDPLASIAGLLGKLLNPSNWLHLGAMLAGAGLIGFGLWTMTKDLGDTGPQGLVSPMPIILKEGA